MKEIALTISIFALAISIFFAGIVSVYSVFDKEKVKRDSIVQEDLSRDIPEFDGTESNNSYDRFSARIIGETKASKPTPEFNQPAPQQVQSTSTPLPTATPTQEPEPHNAQENELPWAGGFANKEAYCRDVADSEVRNVKNDPPEVDQSNLAPELRVSIDWEAWWNSSYRDCMDFIRNY